MASVQDRVIEVTARVLQLDAADIKPADNFTIDLGAESVQSIELVAQVDRPGRLAMTGAEQHRICHQIVAPRRGYPIAGFTARQRYRPVPNMVDLRIRRIGRCVSIDFPHHVVAEYAATGVQRTVEGDRVGRAATPTLFGL